MNRNVRIAPAMIPTRNTKEARTASITMMIIGPRGPKSKTKRRRGTAQSSKVAHYGRTTVACLACGPAIYFARLALPLGQRSLWQSYGDFMTTALDLEQETNPWQAQAARFDLAAQKLNLDAGLWKVLQSPSREIIVHIPVMMDDGHLEVFTGFRVQHSIARGPAKGGL